MNCTESGLKPKREGAEVSSECLSLQCWKDKSHEILSMHSQPSKTSSSSNKVPKGTANPSSVSLPKRRMSFANGFQWHHIDAAGYIILFIEFDSAEKLT